MKLNLGCGRAKLDGHVNVDKYDTFSPEVVWDLETFPWPFDDNSAEAVVMQHCLEHMGALPDTFLGIMKELYRVCAPNAEVTITVPHPRSEGYAGDPTHVRPISPTIMQLFSKAVNEETLAKGWPNTPLALYLDVDFETVDVKWAITPHWMEQVQSGRMTWAELEFAAQTYFNVISEVTMTLAVRK